MASFMKTWVRPEIYPLFAVMGVGVGFAGYYNMRMLFNNPDAVLYKSDREAFSQGATARHDASAASIYRMSSFKSLAASKTVEQRAKTDYLQKLNGTDHTNTQ